MPIWSKTIYLNSFHAHIIFLGLIIFLLSSCTQEKKIPTEVITFPESYFPLIIGQSKVYKVKLSKYNEIGEPKVVQEYFLHHTTLDTFMDEDGRFAYKVRVDSSNSLPISEGKTIGYKSFSRYQNGAEIKDGNTRIVVLEAPVKVDHQWNGLRYTFERPTGFNPQQFKYIHIDTAIRTNDRIYENCIVIQQRRIDDLSTYKVLTYEVYAPEIGLIKRYDNYQVLLIKPNGTEIDGINSYLYESELVLSN